ncbi:MAG: Na+/H+ antiporter subunit B [Myxococcota bacterium]|nr:Na+/H+ antiporter subunit B [Myxococcota bacterium]
MSSVILRTAARYMMPLLLLFSVFLLWRGHHEPGGGFAGGLVAATAFVLVAFSEGPAAARRSLPISTWTLIPIGLGLSSVSALLPLLQGLPPLTGLWLPGDKLGTPLLFDAGVYATVLGVVASVLLALMEEETS